MPVTMAGSPKSPTDAVAAQKFSVLPPKQEVNKYLKGLPENEARQNAKMRSDVSKTLGGKSRRMKGGLDQFGRATGKEGEIDDSRQEGGAIGAISSSGAKTEDHRTAHEKKFDADQVRPVGVERPPPKLCWRSPALRPWRLIERHTC
jgi:hypothetical protein